MNSWKQFDCYTTKNTYIELYKLNINSNTYMIVDFSYDIRGVLKCYDYIGFTVCRDEGEIISILESIAYSL